MSINRAIADTIADLKAALCCGYVYKKSYLIPSLLIESLGPPYITRYGQRRQLAQEIHGYADVMLERRFASLLEDRNAVAVRNERREFFSKLSMPHCKSLI